MSIRKIESDEIVPLLLCWAGSLGVLPFAIMRLVNGDWLIGVIDSLIVVSMASLGIFVFRTQRLRPACIYLAVLVISGALITVYLKGPMQVFWTFPAFMVAFYILKPNESLLLVLAAIAALIPGLMGQITFPLMASILVTLLITVSIAYSFALQTIQQQRRLVSLATHDPLTNTGNRRALDEELNRVVALRNRTGVPCSLLLIDLDRFKRVNDQHGHAVGDQTLVCVSRTIASRIRMSDRLYRIGGEEFVVIVNNQRLSEASVLAEQLRVAVEQCHDVLNIHPTISIGVAELVSQESPRNWLARADKALYEAKDNGRNTTCEAPFPKQAISSVR